MIITKSQAEKSFNWVITILFTILVIGTPLFFSSITRSVFEVNKLLLLRVIIFITYFLWIAKYLWFKSNEYDNKAEESYTIFGLRWKKMGLEIPLLIWFGFNILSTIFSQSLVVAIIGAYDRWEGILTVSNYLMLMLMFGKLVTEKIQLNWIIYGLIMPTVISSIYGIIQSTGFDFMNWSVDPTARVFACINNPVHFCPYVAMIVCLGLGVLLYNSAKKTKKSESNKNTIFSNIYLSLTTLISALIIWKMLKTPLNGYIYLITTGLLSTALITFIKKVIQKNPINFQIFFKNIKHSTSHSLILSIASTSIMSLLIFTVLQTHIYLGQENWQTFIFISSILLIGIALLFKYIDQTTRNSWIIISVIVCYYAQFLSYSRAAWIGFIFAMPIFYMISTNILNREKQNGFIIDSLASIGITFIFICHQIFHLEKKIDLLLPSFIILELAYLGYIFWINCKNIQKEKLTKYGLIGIGITSLALLTYYDYTLPAFLNYLPIFLGLILCGISYLIPKEIKLFLARIIILFIFAKVQFVALGIQEFLLFLILILNLYLLIFKEDTSLKKEKKIWLYIFLLIFGFIIFLPSLPKQLEKINPSLFKNNLRAVDNITSRLNVIKSGDKGQARFSMWRSAIPWAKNYWLFGSGLDTTKYMYPVYREPVYGILEGGHNYTPDRLHNEYLTYLTTLGTPGTLVFYIGVILGWFILLLRFIYQNPQSPYRYLCMGLMAGVLVYYGQVLFNFGVVATKVLMFIYIGLGLAIASHPAFKEKKSEEEIA